MRLFFILMLLFSLLSAKPQTKKFYNVTSGEIIISSSELKLASDFTDAYPNASIIKTNPRLTVFFHLGQYWHLDLTNSFGLYSGIGIRNVGMISNETLPAMNGSGQVRDYKIIRRVYTLGIPLAIKVGSFDDHLYVFAGGECELAFHYKEKYWSDTQIRSGESKKYTEWFGSQTPAIIPSVFAGIQMPGGVNIKAKYYLNDFLNYDYAASGNTVPGATYDVSDLRRYEKSSVFYISICWQFKTDELTEKAFPPKTVIACNK